MMLSLTLLLALAPSISASTEAGTANEAPSCSDVMEQIKGGESFVGPSNFVVQFSREDRARSILFLQQPAEGDPKLRWRLIERQANSQDYCITGQGDQFSALADLHLSRPFGKYGMPGSGLPRCAGTLESGIPGSLDIRMWANKELGNSLIYHLPNEKGSRDFVVLFSTDNTGAWIILDTDRDNPGDTCYYDRGDSSRIVENFKSR